MAKVKYSKQKIDGWKLRVHPECTDPQFTALCCCEDKRTHPSFETFRDSRNTLLFRFNWNGKTFYHKEFKSPTRGRQLRKWFRAFLQIRVVEALRCRGLACPDVFCAGRKGTRIFCVYEAIEADGNAPGIYKRIIQGLETRITAGDFLYEFGKFTGTMHRKRVAHGDYQWGNVLVRFDGNTPSFVLIDNDRTSAVIGLIYWYRMRNLIQLMHAANYIPDEDWEKFWIGYTESYTRGRRWRSLIERLVRTQVTRRQKESAKRKGVRS